MEILVPVYSVIYVVYIHYDSINRSSGSSTFDGNYVLVVDSAVRGVYLVHTAVFDDRYSIDWSKQRMSTAAWVHSYSLSAWRPPTIKVKSQYPVKCITVY